MNLTGLDWGIVIAFFVISLLIGLLTMKKAGSSAAEFFLSGRNMPWWLLGVSMVATTFSADTPNLVTDLVRQQGVAGNWAWWAFLLTGMLTVFVYARLWRRSKVLTDLEFYELRYSGKEAAFLRGFRALYLGVFFNIVIMATVCLAATKIGSILLGLAPWETLLIASVVTVIYSALGGLRGVIITDFFQFLIAMAGSIGAAWVILDKPEVNGMAGLINHPNVIDKLDLIPSMSNPDIFIGVLIIPLAVQWWSVWYPGAEPGGGGYIAQRMLSAKNEKHAVYATLFFNIAHYALRPWPWILIALASLIMFPDIASIHTAFPDLAESQLGHDLAYSAMLTYLPAGLLGLVVASLVAAFMSTISTHLNWGASYVVNDFYVRFIKPSAKDKEQIWVGRLTTVVLMIVAALLSLFIGSAKEGFNVLLQIGAGTGLIFILRWFWWRINAYTEIAGMAISFVFAIILVIVDPNWPDWVKLVTGVGVTTAGWLLVTFLTPATNSETLIKFYKLIRPSGKGWHKLAKDLPVSDGHLPRQILSMLLGCVMVYAALFSTGQFIYDKPMKGWILFGVVIVSGLALMCTWRSIQSQDKQVLD
jgi:solute:Na+ symporter, SSS family